VDLDCIVLIHVFLIGIEDELKNLVSTQCSELKSRGLSRGFLEKAHDASSPSQPDLSSLVHLTRRVQLWPAAEYLAMLWQYRVTADFIAQACLRR
jgi:midasin